MFINDTWDGGGVSRARGSGQPAVAASGGDGHLGIAAKARQASKPSLDLSQHTYASAQDLGLGLGARSSAHAYAEPQDAYGSTATGAGYASPQDAHVHGSTAANRGGASARDAYANPQDTYLKPAKTAPQAVL